jgi:hypothetical protein
VVALGSNVTIAGHVTGSVIGAGNSITVNGPVDGSVRVAGNTVSVGAPVGTDLLAAGSALIVNPGASIGRDLLAAGRSVTVQAPVTRNVKASAGTLTLASSVGGAVDANVSNLVIGSGASIEGPVSYVSAQDATVGSGATLQQAPRRTNPPAQSSTPWEIGGVDTLAWLRGFIGLAVFGGLLALAFPRVATTTASIAEQRWLASFGLGFGLLVGLPVVALLVFIAGVAIGGWWIGLTLFGLYGLLLVLGYVMSAQWVGLTALRLSNSRAHPAVAMLLGLFVLSLVGLIPVLGGLVGLAAVLFGVGALALSAWHGYRGEVAATTATATEGSPLPVGAAA